MTIGETRTAEFLALYSACQRRLYAYIRAQVRSPSDADDVLQETSAVLWRKFDEFERGSDFARWASRVARLEVLTHQRHAQRVLSIFSPEVAEAVSEQLFEVLDTVDVRHEALSECLQKLPRRHRELIARRYQAMGSVAGLARKLGRSESAVYKLLTRIHDTLYECVEAALKARTSEERP